MSFGKRLKISRKNKNLTQKALADLINAKHNSVSNWENDQNKPDPDTICLICGVLDISIDYLLGKEKIATLSDDDLNAEFFKLIPLLNEAEQDILLSQIKGIFHAKEK